MNIVSEYVSDFVSLFFPNLCCACGKPLVKGEEVICTYCSYYLPKTGYHLQRNNPLEKHFWGRVELERAAACYFFQKGSRIQQLIHALKYKGKTEVGIAIGKIYGQDLLQSADFSSVDLIVPVPLHQSKELQRTYNQADLFSEGLSLSMNKPWNKQALKRVTATQTQTHKSRFERWQNVGTVFRVGDPGQLTGKHILITDDVVTTGSTLEACAREILQLPQTKVSLATIACAVM